MKNNNDFKTWYLDNFNKFKKSSDINLNSIRDKAVVEFENSKFPTKKDEEWKYTNIKPIIENDFLPSPLLEKSAVKSDIVEDYSIKDLDVYKFVFINGIFNKELSTSFPFDNGIIANSLKNLSNTNNPIIKKIISSNDTKKNIFNLLNTVFAYDGFVLYLPERKLIDKPIHILNIASDTESKPLNQPINFIHLEKNSKVEIIFEYVGLNNAEYFTNAITNISLDENSILNIYKLQNETESSFHIEKTNIKQKDSSTLKHFSLSFGASITRNDISSFIDGENVECNLFGLYLGNKNQQIDHHTYIEHIKPNSNSNELYKGILDDNSKGIFSGKILVQKEAQKTNAFQSNKSVLLSNSAISDAKPQLEIYADDVKCSHGATVGKLDQEALFYIQSRGIPLELARSMLIRAFIDDVVKEINIGQLREKVNHTIFEHLKRVEF